MEDENQQNDHQIEKRPFDFLEDREGKELFAILDFQLKSGAHIQLLHPEQEALFHFIQKYLPTLRNYYRDFFGVVLDSGGIDSESDLYYFLDFDQGNRGAIPADKRDFLSAEHLIIGIFACKVFNIDLHHEESSLSAFSRLIREEYEEYKPDFYRLLANAKSQHTTGDEKVDLDKSIKSALREFAKLGWLYFKDDKRFVILPSLERLRRLYADEINNIQALVNGSENEK